MKFSGEVFGNEIDFTHPGAEDLLLFWLGLACLQVVVAAIIVCARSRIKDKGLWIAIIILLHISVKIAGEASIISIFIMHFGFDTDSPWVFSFVVPLGAILFLCYEKETGKIGVPLQTAGGCSCSFSACGRIVVLRQL